MNICGHCAWFMDDAYATLCRRLAFGVNPATGCVMGCVKRDTPACPAFELPGKGAGG